MKKFKDMFRRFDRIPACDRETDRRTDGQTDILRQRYVASRGKISARPLTLLIFAIGWALGSVRSTTTRT